MISTDCSAYLSSLSSLFHSIYTKTKKIRALTREIENHGEFEGMEVGRKEQVIALLRRGGARASLDIF